MTVECEKFESAKLLFEDLMTDVFSIIELGFGPEMADKIWDDYMEGLEDEDGCDVCDAEQAIVHALEGKDLHALVTAVATLVDLCVPKK